MPQMAPSWWTMILIIAISMTMMFMTKIYFDNSIMPKIYVKKKEKFINWKW